MAGQIHLQDNLSKAPLVGREQNIQQASADLAQRQASQALDQERVLDQSRAHPSGATDTAENRVDRRQERRGQGRGDADRHRDRSGQGGGSSDEAGAEPASSSEEHRIDVVA